MTKGINKAAIEKATGKSWDEWLEFFESINAKDLTHQEIAAKVRAAGTSGWWAQNVTVAYEQHAGRRAPGQRSDGTFTVSISKTVDGKMDEVFANWLELAKDMKEFDGVKLAKEAAVNKTEKYRNWRVALADGSRVVVGIYQKTPDKTMFPLAHEKLQSAVQAEEKRAFWKKFLENFK